MIRNAHFKDKAMHKGPKQNNNLKAVVATTFPFKPIILPPNCMQTNSNTLQMLNSTERDARERNNLSKMQPPTVIRASAYQSINNSRIIKIIPVTRSQLNKLIAAPTTCKTAHSKSGAAIPKTNSTNARTTKKVSNAAIKKVPVLKITINKKYNKPPASNLNKQAVDAASDVRETKKGEEGVNPDVRDHARNIDAVREPIVVDLVPAINENATVGANNAYTPKIAYARKGDLSRDNSRCQTSAEKVRYLYTKAQRDCDILRIRLKALKERQKQEKLEVRKLQVHLGHLSKGATKEPAKPEEYTARKSMSLLLGDAEEDECAELLRKVRRIQRDILNPNYSAAAAADKRLERTSAKRKITRVYGRRKTNNGSEVIFLKREIVNEVCADVLEDFRSEDYAEAAVKT